LVPKIDQSRTFSSFLNANLTTILNKYSFNGDHSVHIPDGYLSPTTVVVSYLAVAPLWMYGFKRLKRSLNEETLPMIGALTALSFVIMMFNIPIPGGTSGHAVGAALIAIMFDPWIASIAVSLVLFIQAVVFADGGISALAINALGMAFGGAFGGYYLFKLLHSHAYAPFVAGWASAVVASVIIALGLGIQPLFWSEGGKPLYFPFDLTITLPALVGEHALIFGVIEGIFTTIAYRFLTRKDAA
jgi:cobalt/nickel transport system permease protein